MMSHTTNPLEHAELVAGRIVRYAKVAGPENLIAGADCGFAATARMEPDIHLTVAFAKLQALADGARLASQQVW